MNLAADDLSIDQTYRLMTGMIVPRPIAWVTTQSSAGTVNLAPFSAFTFLSTKPPIIGISITRRAGALKDTARNIEETGEFVVNIADDTFLDALHASSAEYPPDVSEPEVLGLTLVPSRSVAAPRLADVPAAMECRLERTIEFGDLGARLCAGAVLHFYVRDSLLVDGKIATQHLRPLGRVAGPRYARLGEIIEVAPLHEGSRRYSVE